MPGVILFLPYNSCLCLAGFGQVLCGVGGSVDKSIDKKSWTMSAAAMPVISAAENGPEGLVRREASGDK